MCGSMIKGDIIVDSLEILEVFLKVVITVSLHGIFVSAIIKPRYSKLTNFLTWLVITLVIGIVVTWEHVKYLGPVESGHGFISFLTTLLLVTVTSVILSKDSVSKKIFLFMIVLNIFVAVMVLSVIICRYIPFSSPNASFYLQSTLYLIVILSYIFLLRKHFLRFEFPDSRKWWSLALALMLFAMVMLGKVYVYDDITYFDLGDDILMCSLVFFGIAFFILTFDVIGNVNKGAVAEQSKLKASIYAEKLKAMRENENTYLQLVHDRQHHVSVLLDLVKKGDKAEVLSYLENLLSDSFSGEVIDYCDNEVVNSVISAFAIQAKQSGLIFSVGINVPADINIKSHDLVVVLSNLLENAINGALEAKADRKEVIIKCSLVNHKLTIICRNTCKEAISFSKGVPYSKLSEGLGISSIMSTVNKYDGKVKFLAEHGTFLANITMEESR